MEALLMGTEKAQALMELAVGMFTIALVVSLLTAYAMYIAKSLKAQNTLRSGNSASSSSKSDTVEVGEFAGEHLFGKSKLQIREKVVMPSTVIIK
jgi:hypothetical protein